jgi:hypothetical protein
MANRTFVCPRCGFLRRAVAPDFKVGIDSKLWPRHCDEPMFLLGYRAAQAATQITAAQRIKWLKLGARVMEHNGRRRWRAILKAEQLKGAYPGA